MRFSNVALTVSAVSAVAATCTALGSLRVFRRRGPQPHDAFSSSLMRFVHSPECVHPSQKVPHRNLSDFAPSWRTKNLRAQLSQPPRPPARRIERYDPGVQRFSAAHVNN